MSLREIYAEVAPWATGLGFPSAIAYFGRRLFLKTRAERRKERAEADYEEGTLDARLKTASVTQIESQMVAMTKAWDSERAALLGTVEHQRVQLVDERAYSASREAIITELRAQLENLQAQLGVFQSRVTELATQLAALQTPGPDELS